MTSRRALLISPFLVRLCAGFEQTAELLRGKLVQNAGQQPSLETQAHKVVPVTGDEPTGKILRDLRLAGKILEVKGHWADTSRFAIDPIETRPMVVVDGTKRFRVTYYCDVCSIRTYSPGPCMCCQAETRLDLIDPAAKE
ncbi:MAG: hypothetical protein M3Z09_07690 [Acidobacteriota bacterium]|nr:hypothetical protein [Acidobacteriota bacterium]